jgi:hypothetical protein
MTEKDFKAIAAILKKRFGLDSGISHEAYTLKWLSHDLAEYFRTTNKRFDYDLFMRECGHPSFQQKKEKK